MKKVFSLSAMAIVATLSGCATPYPVGGILTDITVPVTTTSSQASTKVGTAKCTSVLTLVATGDCSLEAAKKAGGITEVSHVDWKANNILGIIGNYELIVHGQ